VCLICSSFVEWEDSIALLSADLRWQSIVKADREASTLKFATGEEDVPSTVTINALSAKVAALQVDLALMQISMLLCRYEVTKKDVSKWQSIVKANREAVTLRFAAGNEDVPKTTTTSALTAKFAPSQDYEKEIAAMLEAAGAHNEQAVQEAEEALALKVNSIESCSHWASLKDSSP